ncbi:MAG: FKBP-type peptidyl-prolyl cis-trans isomerase [Cytophagales bacterium]|nr:MAG: FKBP-type peptidyl-prolyl cis-trans isomerase [Cytophagales bacterium]
MKKTTLTIILIAFFANLQAQQRINLASGISYILFAAKEKGKKVETGDILSLSVVVKNHKDSVLQSSYDAGFAYEVTTQPPQFAGDPSEVLYQMQAGDSVITFIPIEMLIKGMGQDPNDPNSYPVYAPKGTELKYLMKIHSIKDAKTAEAEKENAIGAMKKEQEETIQKYLKNNNLQSVALPSGLHVIITKNAPEGRKAQANDMVAVHYKGYLLNGEVFDESYQRGEPIEFTLGVGQVITGWDEGIGQMRIGEKAKLIIPSYLGYGEKGAGGVIPPNAILVFDVELMNIRE